MNTISKLLVLFLVGFIGLSLRYILLGKFEWDQLFILLLFPVASILILFLSRWHYNKDRDFSTNEMHFVTRLGDRVSTTPKQMYKDKAHIGSYHRFYHSRWKRIVADTMDGSGQWYLNLSFSLLNGDQVIFKGINENKLRGNNHWDIYYNDSKAGTIRTDFSMKNAAKLNESLYLEYGDNVYHYRSFGIGSKTEIYFGDCIVATGKRIGQAVYQLEMNVSEEEHDSELLLMGFILFTYQFNQ